MCRACIHRVYTFAPDCEPPNAHGESGRTGAAQAPHHVLAVCRWDQSGQHQHHSWCFVPEFPTIRTKCDYVKIQLRCTNQVARVTQPLGETASCPRRYRGDRRCRVHWTVWNRLHHLCVDDTPNRILRCDGRAPVWCLVTAPWFFATLTRRESRITCVGKRLRRSGGSGPRRRSTKVGWTGSVLPHQRRTLPGCTLTRAR